jgi:chromosome segregation ATPase
VSGAVDRSGGGQSTPDRVGGRLASPFNIIRVVVTDFVASRMYDGAPPPATKKQQTALKNKLLEGESSFSAHCRSFESQIRDLNQQFNAVKEKVGDLHRDITALRKAQTPPLTARYDLLMRECLHLDQNLERQQQELDRMATTFDASWEEQLWRLRVEQEVFSCQRADVMTLRNELKHLSQLAGQLEPYIRSLTPAQQSSQSESAAEQSQQMQSLLEHFSEYVSYLKKCKFVMTDECSALCVSMSRVLAAPSMCREKYANSMR